jgi:ribosomal protein S4
MAVFKTKSRRHKPLYKKFITLRTNVQGRKRLYLLKFKKKKWEKLISYITRLIHSSKKNFRTYDLNRYYLPKFYNSFKNRYRMVLYNKKKISLFYGNFLIKYLKKQVNMVIQNKKSRQLNVSFLSLIEKRLDVILYRSHFARSIVCARQLILHKHVQVNGFLVTNQSFILKSGDIIGIFEKSKFLIDYNVSKSFFWPIPPKHLSINYKTFEIIFNGQIEESNLSTLYPFFPNIYYLLRYYR